MTVDIINISDGKIKYKYVDNEIRYIIDLKESSNIWWDKHHKASINPLLLREKKKNKYAGDRLFCIGTCYIRFYTDNEEIKFICTVEKDMDTSDFCELREY